MVKQNDFLLFVLFEFLAKNTERQVNCNWKIHYQKLKHINRISDLAQAFSNVPKWWITIGLKASWNSKLILNNVLTKQIDMIGKQFQIQASSSQHCVKIFRTIKTNTFINKDNKWKQTKNVSNNERH